jgi:hypothetical protein
LNKNFISVCDDNIFISKLSSTQMNTFAFAVCMEDGGEEGEERGRPCYLSGVCRIAPDCLDGELQSDPIKFVQLINMT